MSDDDDKNVTLIGIRKQAKGQKLTDDEQLAVENHARFMIALRRFIEHMVNYWKRWVLFLIGSAIGGWSMFDMGEFLK